MLRVGRGRRSSSFRLQNHVFGMHRGIQHVMPDERVDERLEIGRGRPDIGELHLVADLARHCVAEFVFLGQEAPEQRRVLLEVGQRGGDSVMNAA